MGWNRITVFFPYLVPNYKEDSVLISITVAGHCK